RTTSGYAARMVQRALGLTVLLACVACGPEAAKETTDSSGGESTSTSGGGSQATTGGDDTVAPAPTTSSDATTTSVTTTAPTTTDEGSTTAAPIEPCREIVVADPLLEARIREALVLPNGPIPVDAAESLVELSVFGEVGTLAGLECFTGLELLQVR